MNTFINIVTTISLCILLTKKKVATTRSVRFFYIVYINDFAILDAIADFNDYSYCIKWILLLIPADTITIPAEVIIIDPSKYYY